MSYYGGGKRLNGEISYISCVLRVIVYGCSGVEVFICSFHVF